MKTVCLNMIVKNESKAIRKLLESVKNIIDYWVIFDTGSTDGTQEIIREFLKEIPGELHERPWVDFAHNRNEALEVAQEKADFILILDADHKLIVLDSFDKNALDQDFYLIMLKGEGDAHYRPLLINNDRGWLWQGVIHETMVHSRKMQGMILKDLIVECHSMDGRRSQDPQKYYKDAEVLKKAVEDDPCNSRYVFYLAQSYHVVKEYALALQQFEKRALMDGEPAETFWTLFSIGCLQETLEMSPETIIWSFCKAYEFDQTRAEPLHRLAMYLMHKGCPSFGFMIANYALNLKKPNVLNTDYYPWVYDWGLLAVIGDCALKLKKFDEAIEAYQKSLTFQEMPREIRRGIEAGLRRIPRKQKSGLDMDRRWKR